MAKTPSKPPAKSAAPKPVTAKKIETIASKGMRAPSTLTTAEAQTLAAEVMRHIEPRKGGKP